MYENNAFITLTYSEENLKSNRLIYSDFQKFVKSLRHHIFDEHLKRIFPYAITHEERRECAKTLTKEARKNINERLAISVFCAGEYGDKRKRPHWHALIFNWSPPDRQPKYKNGRGDQVYDSEILRRLWPHGISELGAVTFQSAGYCARYASKKLAHGLDGQHEFEPISRRSSKNAIGKKWIEKHWRDVFTHGYVIQEIDGQFVQGSIPRYYEKWFQKNHPDEWRRYVTEVKPRIVAAATAKEEKITLEEKKINLKRAGLKGIQIKRNETRKKILEKKFNELQKLTKL